MNTHALTETDPACHLETFEPAGDFATHAATLRLPPRVWDIALALKGPATAAELSARTGMPAGAVLAALRQLEADKLVSKLLIQCPGIAASIEAPLAEAKPAGATQAATIQTPTAEKPPALPAPNSAARQPVVANAPLKAAAPTGQTPPAKPAPGPQRGSVRVSLRGTQSAAGSPAKPAHADSAAQARPTEAAAAAPALEAPKPTGSVRVSLRGAAKTEQAKPKPAGAAASGPETSPSTAEVIALPATVGGGSWLVQPVLDSLRAKAGGDPLVGQLLAYRVFLRVPANLLQAAGIRSVCLIEPDLRISDPRLKAAIEQALREVAGLSWPETKPAAA